ncbi:MAG TPA: Ig-like domain-containing protein, partial [Actinomycetota bacterium]|nr:Ig-like domain-containing protein [Actinomycetota bacterium]
MNTGLLRRAALFFSVAVLGGLLPATAVTAQDSDPGGSPPSRQELVGRRTQTSKTYLNPNGTLTTTFFSGPVHYEDGRGRWKEIEDELVATEDGPYAVRNGKNAFDVAFKQDAGEGYLRFGAGGSAFDFTLQGAARAAATSRGRGVSYDEVMPGVDLDYELLPEGLKETLVLDGPHVPTNYRFVMSSSGGAPARVVQRPDGTWEVYTGGDAPAFTFSPPTVVEAPSREPDEPAATPTPEATPTPDATPSPAPSPLEETPGPEPTGDPESPAPSPAEATPEAVARAAAPESQKPSAATASPAATAPPGRPAEPGKSENAGTSGKESQANVALDVQPLGNGRFAVELSVDPQWLHDPEREFPILLDPTIIVPTTAEDASYASLCGGCVAHVDKNLYLGTGYQDVWRNALKFDVSQMPTDQIIGAELQLWHDGSCLWNAPTCSNTSRDLELYRMTGPWNLSTTVSQLQFDPARLGVFTLPAGAKDLPLTWNVTQTVKDWIRGTAPAHGFLVKQEQEVLGSGGAILPYGRRHAQMHRRPLLQVNYTDVPVTLDPIETIHSNGAELSWTPYSSATGEAFQKYEIHRSENRSFVPNDATTLLRTITDRTTTTFVDTTAAPNKAFTYRIVANDTFTSNARLASTPADGQALKYVQEEPYALSQDTTILYNKDYQYCQSHGREPTLSVGSMSWERKRSLLRFDLDGIPAGATVHQAKLSLLQRQDSLPWDRTVSVQVHRATRGWVQGTWVTDWCNGRGATWYTIDGANAWANAGADFDPAVEASATVPPNGLAERNNFMLTSLVSKWVSGQAPNFGVVVKASDETLTDWNRVGYYSTDTTIAGLDQDQRPTLEIRYEDGSHSVAPSVALTKPLGGATLRGNAETLSATATDDGRVALVEFLVDGNVVASDLEAPYSVTWNSTTVANGSRSFTVRARDEVGNVTTSQPVQAAVANSAPPSSTLVAPAASSTVAGPVTLVATASDDGAVDRVEFLVDGYSLATDATAPYEASWDTLAASPPSYNGTHQLSAVAYDDHGQKTTSSSTVTVANAPASKYKGTLTSTSMPQEVLYEPPTCGTGGNQPCTQPVTAINVTYKNTSTQTWYASDIVLKYRWLTPTGTVVATGTTETALRGDWPGGTSPKVLPVRVDVDPPVLDPGIDRAQFLLRIDLFEKSTGTWFASKGNAPLEAPVIVHKLKATDMLGLERFFQYTGTPVGAGMGHLVNAATGNSILRWTPFASPGRGLSSVLDLTYNALEDKTESPAGNNWSLSLSTLTRFGNPLDIHPNNADTIAGNPKRMVRFTDGDGTTHEFLGKQAADGTIYWEEPQGVHLWLRTYSTTNAARKWALTRPDGVTFFYNADGYPTSVEDRNGNKLVFGLEQVPPGEDPGGFKYRITSVTDAAGVAGAPNRSFNVDYYTKDEAKFAHVRGKIQKITDHNGSAIVFDYYHKDGNLLRLTQKGGLKADGTPLADRSFVFTYTTSAGNGPAIADPAARQNPNPETSGQSTRLYSVRDPEDAETVFTYLGSGTGLDRWKLSSVTDRAGKQTTFAYGSDRTTTVTAPMSRVTKFTFDSEGKVTSILDPKGQTTSVSWNPERHVNRVEEPGGGVTRFAYNANGYLTDKWNQLDHHTVLTYDNLAVAGESGPDTRDAAAYWKAGRAIPHMSELASVTDPRGNATEFDYDPRGNVVLSRDQEDFETTYDYDPANGNLISVTDANLNVTRFLDYDANGFPRSVQDGVGNVTKMTYDDDGLMRSLQLPRNSGRPVSSYTAILYEYDAFHRLGRQSRPKSDAEVVWSGTDYDANDNVVLQRSPDDGLPQALSAPGFKTVFSYDPMDRLLLREGPDGDQKVGYTYDDAG